MGQVRFKVCSEVLEYRRRAVYRHQKFVKQLALFSSMLSRRRRNQHGNQISLNQIAEKMSGYVKQKDRADDKLLAKFMTKYMKEIREALQGLKDANAKLNLINSRIAKTKKYNMWLAACKMFMRRIKATQLP